LWKVYKVRFRLEAVLGGATGDDDDAARSSSKLASACKSAGVEKNLLVSRACAPEHSVAVREAAEAADDFRVGSRPMPPGDYDDAIKSKLGQGKSGEKLFIELALEDLTQAADLFRPVYDLTCGNEPIADSGCPSGIRDTYGLGWRGRQFGTCAQWELLKVRETAPRCPFATTPFEEGGGIMVDEIIYLVGPFTRRPTSR